MSETTPRHSVHPPQVIRPRVSGFTIDSATSKDLDDAIWAERIPNGYRLTISIADVAAQIPLGSELDLKAKQRVETRYLREGNQPMLPRGHSEGLLSLFPNEARDVVTVTVDLGPDGTTLTTAIAEAKLVSMARFSHEETDLLLRSASHPLRDQVALCQEVATKRLARRREGGALAFYDLKQGLYADEDGVIRQSASSHIHAQIIIQEFMILANEVVATTMARTGRHFLYRNHQARTSAPAREEALRQVNDALLHPTFLPSLLTRMQLWMERASYGPALLGHYGLNLAAYSHFTSPIRRYADLVNHRLVKAAINGEPEPYSTGELTGIAHDINAWKEAQAEATQDHFREKAIQQRRKALVEPLAVLDGMDSRAFSQALEQAVKDDTPAEYLLQALDLRIERHALTAVDLYYLFFRGGNGWDLGRRTAMKAFENEPPLSLMVLELLRSKDQASLDYQVLPTSTGRFQAKLAVTFAGKSLGAVVSKGATSKKTTQAMVATTWLQGRLDGSLVAPEDLQFPSVPTPQSASEADAPNANHVALLNEWCQKSQVPTPVFEYASEGPSHLPTFRATASVHGASEILRVQGPPAGSKQEAKRLAAREILTQILARS